MAATSRRRPSDVPPWVAPMLAKPDGGRLPSGPHLSYDDKLDFCTRFTCWQSWRDSAGQEVRG